MAWAGVADLGRPSVAPRPGIGYRGAMGEYVSIRMDEKLVDALREAGRLVIRIVEPGTPAKGAARLSRDPTPGTHMATLVEWASARGAPFRTSAAAKALRLTKRHASVLLVNAVQENFGIIRLSHGVYGYRA